MASASAAANIGVFAANRAIGRIALAVKANAGATRRARVREQGPLRVRCPGPPSSELEAVILNTAGGVAGGDRLEVAIDVAREARMVVTSAAAEKIYRALDMAATIEVKLSVAAGATLAWLPQETILFHGARLRRAIEVELAADARLLMAEAIVFGRPGMGEAVDDGCLFDRWRVRRDGVLLHAEALRLEGCIARRLSEPAVADGRRAIATVLAVPAGDGATAAVRALAAQCRGEVGASAWNGRMLLRLCAADSAALRHDLVLLVGAIRGAALPRLWLN